MSGTKADGGAAQGAQEEELVGLCALWCIGPGPPTPCGFCGQEGTQKQGPGPPLSSDPFPALCSARPAACGCPCGAFTPDPAPDTGAPQFLV